MCDRTCRAIEHEDPAIANNVTGSRDTLRTNEDSAGLLIDGW